MFCRCAADSVTLLAVTAAVWGLLLGLDEQPVNDSALTSAITAAAIARRELFFIIVLG
jgi:predicted benzoate:H+ symporter BenE